jgi:toxin YhaV
MTGAHGAPLVVHGWRLFAHPIFLDQVEALIAQVEADRARDPSGYRSRAPAKRLAAVAKLCFEVIPADPTRPEYRQGATLGPDYKHWFRAKFFQQYRLFFRYHQASRILVYAWVNDTRTKRAYDSADDAYRSFRKMLDRGRPPDDWRTLLREAGRDPERLRRIGGHMA